MQGMPGLPQMQGNPQNMQKFAPLRGETTIWPPENQPPPQTGQVLSVVTTVWGNTQTTQSGPANQNPNFPNYTNTTMSSVQNYNPAQQQPQHGYNQPMQKPGLGGYPGQGMPYQTAPQYNMNRPPGGYPPPHNPQGNGSDPNTHAVAAATAAATAIAAVSVIAEQEVQRQKMQQQQQQQQMSPYGNQMVPNQVYDGGYPQQAQRLQGPMMGPAQGMQGPVQGRPTMYNQRRPAPYHKPQQYAARQPYGQSQQFNGGNPGSGYPPMKQFASNQQGLPSPTYPQPPNQPRQSVPPYNCQNPNMFMQNQFMPQQPPTQNYNPQFTGDRAQVGMYQSASPIPGNPTPPITPSTTGPPMVPQPQTQAPDIKPTMLPDIKPPGPYPGKAEKDEMRLTFPVRDGTVLQPFRLEHNLAVSNHAFHLRDNIFSTLMWRSDLELQLKCFHHEDRQMNTNWPASVTVSVNAQPLAIQRGENKTSHKPLYFKEFCQPGRNTLQITVTACCCSHLFVLQLVHRPSVRSVLQGLLRKRLLPVDHCVAKIKRNFTTVATSNTALNQDDGVEQTAIKVPLKCPITFRRITLPARGHDCKHIQCFDLESYLQLNCERGSWRCPVCSKTALLEGLEIDQYVWSILNNLQSTEFEEVTIDQTASWKPVPVKVSNIKEEDSGTESACSSWTKAKSPSSMSMPNINTWDPNYDQPSPSQVPPPMSQPPQGGPQYSHPYPNMPPGGLKSENILEGLSQISENVGNDIMSEKSPEVPSPNPGPGRPPSRQTGSGGRPQSQPSMAANSNVPVTKPCSNSPIQNPATNKNQKQATNNTNLDEMPNEAVSDLNELPFDPLAIIDGVGQSQESVDLLPDNIGDDLLSVLGPQDVNNIGSNENSGGNGASDDFLALFDT